MEPLSVMIIACHWDDNKNSIVQYTLYMARLVTGCPVQKSSTFKGQKTQHGKKRPF